MKRPLLFLLGCLPGLLAGEINPGPLREYISLGLKNNLALQQQQFSLEKSLETLKEARTLFFPTLEIQARATTAGGGRVIDFPVGDLLNPLYGSLNDLFRFHDITAGFPTDIPNQQIPFYRPFEHETKVRMVVPLFQPQILFNYKIQQDLSLSESAGFETFRRQLIVDIQNAYFTYMKTVQLGEFLRQARGLLEENQRVSASLVTNGKATEDVLFRAQAELAGIDHQLAEADKNQAQAAAYFNFLLNRPLDSQVEIESGEAEITPVRELEWQVASALAHRDEFRQLGAAIQAAGHHLQLTRFSQAPTLAAVVDFGFQGEAYRFGKKDDYWMASLALQWSLFDGGRRRAQQSQAALEQRKLETRKTELEQLIRLQVQEEWRGLEAARLGLVAAGLKEKSAERSFQIVSKKFANGLAPQIEYLDAQTTYTQAGLERIVARCDWQIRKAGLEWAAAAVDIHNFQ